MSEKVFLKTCEGCGGWNAPLPRARISRCAGKRVLSRSVRWVSSNPSVATVTRSGLVRFKHAGSCKVWAVAHDGVESSHVKAVVKKAPKGKAKKAAPAKRAKALGLMAAGF